jgi:hypothetical protein
MSRTALMPRRLRPTAIKLVIVSGAAAACVAGTVVGVAAASPTSPTSPSSRSTAPTAVKPRPIDHQLCYTAKGTYPIPPAIELFNQFSPKGFVPRFGVGAVAVHCNPVVKILPPTNKKFPITNPAAHLVCLHMAAPVPQPTPKVVVSNQFGSAELIPGQPNLFCLPSFTYLKAPPPAIGPGQPAGLSHFTCYPVKEVPGSPGYQPPPAVLLRDEFVPTGTGPVQAKVSPIPQELCLPTVKTVGTKVYKVVNYAAHLLCFPVTQTPVITPVWDRNQFGISPMTIGRTRWLCLPSSQALVPPPVSHHLCYVASGKFPAQPPAVRLINQFTPHGFAAKVGAVALHCNPVAKTVISSTGTTTFPIINPAAHLACFHIAAARQPARRVIVTNQFGSGLLITGQPNLLCLPTWKSLKAPPNMKTPQPPRLSHFTCYSVREPAGTAGFNPPPVLLRDEFSPRPVQATVGKVPQELCLPTKKIVGTKVFPIVNSAAHLLCFPVTQTPIISPVYDQNQFGTTAIRIIATRWLCVPSTKQVAQP